MSNGCISGLSVKDEVDEALFGNMNVANDEGSRV